MASLDLVPNPTVLVVQAGIFLTNMIVVKKLMVEPYLKVRDRRQKLTLGFKEEAEKILKECESISHTIAERLTKASEVVKEEREKTRNIALEKKKTILGHAETEAKETLDSVIEQINKELTQEKAKIPSIVTQLSDEVYKLALT